MSQTKTNQPTDKVANITYLAGAMSRTIFRSTIAVRDHPSDIPQLRVLHTLTKGFIDGQVGFHHKHGSSYHLGFIEHVTSLPVQHAVDATYDLLRALGRQ